jgi:potassium/chloride transporter 4/5/6
MHDGGVLTLLPYLLRKHRIWKKCRLRVFCVAQEHDDIEQMKRDLDGCLQRFRIDAESHVLDFSRYDISEFTYEKTLRMQQRDELLMEMRLASENDLFLKQNVRRGKKP